MANIFQTISQGLTGTGGNASSGHQMNGLRQVALGTIQYPNNSLIYAEVDRLGEQFGISIYLRNLISFKIIHCHVTIGLYQAVNIEMALAVIRRWESGGNI